MAGRRTPAIVAAEEAGIRFALHEHAPDRRAPSCGLGAAEMLGVDPGRVVKTLVVSLDGELAGRRGLEIESDPGDLMALVAGRVAPMAGLGARSRFDWLAPRCDGAGIAVSRAGRRAC